MYLLSTSIKPKWTLQRTKVLFFFFLAGTSTDIDSLQTWVSQGEAMVATTTLVALPRLLLAGLKPCKGCSQVPRLGTAEQNSNISDQKNVWFQISFNLFYNSDHPNYICSRLPEISVSIPNTCVSKTQNKALQHFFFWTTEECVSELHLFFLNPNLSSLHHLCQKKVIVSIVKMISTAQTSSTFHITIHRLKIEDI